MQMITEFLNYILCRSSEWVRGRWSLSLLSFSFEGLVIDENPYK